MPKDHLNKHSGFLTEKQTQQHQAEILKKTAEVPDISPQEMASTSQTQSADSIVYAELELDQAQRPFKEKSAEDPVEYTQILNSTFIVRADKLKKSLQSNLKEIESLETKIERALVWKLNTNALNENKTALRNAITLKHDLQNQLKEIRGPLNGEFTRHYQRTETEVTDLKERRNNEHSVKYTQLTSELIQTQHAYISLIQKNIEFEQCIANNSKDDLKATAETHLYALYNQELVLRTKLLADLQEKKDIIGQNLQLHSPETPAFESYSKPFHETVDKMVECKNRLFILQEEIASREEFFQKEEVEFGVVGSLGNIGFRSVLEDNPCYEQEPAQPTLAMPLAKTDTHLQGPAVNRSTKPRNIDSSKKNTANSTFKSRFDEFLKSYQETDQPEANNPAPEVNRQLKPRLAQPNFFSTPSSSSFFSDQEEKEKINEKRFACRQ